MTLYPRDYGNQLKVIPDKRSLHSYLQQTSMKSDENMQKKLTVSKQVPEWINS
jgi:hypothetical protein